MKPPLWIDLPRVSAAALFPLLGDPGEAWANGGPVAAGVTATGEGTLLAKEAKTDVSVACDTTINGTYTFTAEIPDEFFREPYPSPFRGYALPAETVRVAINAVHRGTQFHDTCISYLGLRAALPKVSMIQGAR